MRRQVRSTVHLVRSMLLVSVLIVWAGCDDLFQPVIKPSPQAEPDPQAEQPLAISDFSNGPDGWRMPQETDKRQFGWTPNRGFNDTPGLLWDHWSGGLVYYFAAGPHFLGNKSAAMNGMLKFDLRGGSRGRFTPLASQPLVILEGPNGLRLGTGFDPLDRGWHSHAVSLNASGKWMHLGEQRPATNEEIAAALENLVDLRIRAVSTPAILDNVMLVGP